MPVHSSEYSTFRTVTAGNAAPIDRSTEEREAERRADRVGFAEMIKTIFNGDEAAWEAARAFNFPAALGRRVELGGLSESLYSRRAIAAWCAAVRTLAAALPRS